MSKSKSSISQEQEDQHNCLEKQRSFNYSLQVYNIGIRADNISQSSDYSQAKGQLLSQQSSLILSLNRSSNSECGYKLTLSKIDGEKVDCLEGDKKQMNLGRYLQNLLQQINNFQQQEFNTLCFNPIPDSGSISRHFLAQQEVESPKKYQRQALNFAQFGLAEIKNKYHSVSSTIEKLAQQIKRLLQQIFRLKEQNYRLQNENCQYIKQNEQLRSMRNYWRNEFLNQAHQFKIYRQKHPSTKLYSVNESQCRSHSDDSEEENALEEQMDVFIPLKSHQGVNRSHIYIGRQPKIEITFQIPQQSHEWPSNQYVWDKPEDCGWEI